MERENSDDIPQYILRIHIQYILHIHPGYFDLLDNSGVFMILYPGLYLYL